jgi:hypothetical protein
VDAATGASEVSPGLDPTARGAPPRKQYHA